MSEQQKKKSKGSNKESSPQQPPKQTEKVEKTEGSSPAQKPKKEKGSGKPSKEEVKPQVEEIPQTQGTEVQTPEGQQSEKKGKGEQKGQKGEKGFQRDRPEQGRGIVKAVLSGDTIVILNPEKNGPPVEKTITITNINAPRLGRNKPDGSTKDEAFAWQSREFLRKRLVGKVVSYVIENRTQSGGYGVVFEGNNNLAKTIVSEGYARVKRPTGEYTRPDIEELIALEDSASQAGKGIFNKKDDPFVREVIVAKEQTLADLFTKLKNKSQNIWIEQVRAGHSLRALIRDDQDHEKFYDISLFLTGLKCPDYDQYGNPEPFSFEARFFVEHLILNREVSAIFEGADKRSLYGSLNYEGQIINEQLLKNGLGSYVDWQKTALKDKLKAAEKEAQDKRLRIWKNFNAKAVREDESQGKSKEIVGVVVDISSAGALTILDNGRKLKLHLSSIKVPRGGIFRKEDPKKEDKQGKKEQGKKEQGKKEETPVETKEIVGATKPKPKEKENQDSKEKKKEDKLRYWAFEGREYLRKRTIGQKIRAIFDYARPGQDNVEKQFYSVYVDKNNVAVELAEGGYVEVQEHRGTEPRSRDYDQLLIAENLAKKAYKGVFSTSSPSLNIADLSQDSTASKNFFPLLQRAGRLRGVVDHEFSCTKYKIYVPKETCYIFLSLSAVRGPEKDGEFSKEAIELARELCHQRDVEFDVSIRDKGGNFVGNMWILVNGKKKNLASIFLEEGYAYLIPGVAKDNESATELIIAEDSAKKAKKNIWKNYDPEEEKEKYKKAKPQENPTDDKTSLIDVLVTEIVDASKFYVQVITKDHSKLDELMKSLSLQELTEPYTPNKDELVIAKFSEDDAWYRAQVLSIENNEIEVFYVDYGNTEVVDPSKVRPMNPEFKQLPFQAQEARLAYIQTPTLDDEFGEAAASFLKEMVWGRPMMANIEYRDGNVLFLSLGDRESQVHVNAALLRAGLARVEKAKGRHLQPLIEKLKEEESKARAAHVYMWQYGDPGFDDEEERGMPKVKPQPAPKKTETKAPEPKKEEKKEKKK